MNRRGQKQHEQLLKETIKELQNEGYHVIDLDGKSPSAIAVKDNRFYAVIIAKKYKDKHGKWKCKPTQIDVEDRYKMFDVVKRLFYDDITFPFIDRLDFLNGIIDKYEDEGYRIVLMDGKSPDAVATKDNRIYAIEILGMNHRNQLHNTKNWTWKGKETAYDMFDGLMIRTFIYGESGCFTEKFGKQREYWVNNNNNNNNRIKIVDNTNNSSTTCQGVRCR